MSIKKLVLGLFSVMCGMCLITTPVYAKGSGGHGGGHSSSHSSGHGSGHSSHSSSHSSSVHSEGHSSGISRGGKAARARSGMESSRSIHNYGSSRSSRLNKGESKQKSSFSQYETNYNPYRSGGSFHPFYYPRYYYYGGHGIYHNSKSNKDVDNDDEVSKLVGQDSHLITIKDNFNDEHKVVLTKSQYDKINVNDEISISGKTLLVNGNPIN